MIQSSWIDLSKSALRKNIRFIKKQIGPQVTYSSVVKANAYGHNTETFVPLAEECGVRHFSVSNADEAMRVHKSRMEKSKIMIMGDVYGEALEWAVRGDVSFYVFDYHRLELALEIAKRLEKPARIHLELETGMNRTGFDGKWLDKAIELILHNRDCFQVEGICTHYAGAESVANFRRIIDQLESYNKLCSYINGKGLPVTNRHTAASAAALAYPDTRMDMVRVGIAQYGYWPSKEIEMQYIVQTHDQQKKRYIDPLKRVLTWKSRVISIKNVKQGEFIGYGTSYLTTRPHKIAVVPVGYFHGFQRSLSNLGRVLIHGRRVAILGHVNMSMLMINITDVPDVSIDDEVVLIGKQKNNHISVGSFSDMSNMLNYEVLVRIPWEIPRIVVE